MGTAVRYLLNEYTALVGYLRNGRFEINWLATAQRAGPRAANVAAAAVPVGPEEDLQ